MFTLLVFGGATTLVSLFFILSPGKLSGILASTRLFAHIHSSRDQPAAASLISSSSSHSVRAPSSAIRQAGSLPAFASINALSSSLASYLSSQGVNTGLEVYDVTRRQFYMYGNTRQFLTGSSIKVPIMLAFLAMIEKQGREPNGNEMNLLTTMIENSDNDAASTLYVAINGAVGLASYLKQIHVSGLIPNNDAWGYSEITPQAMVDLLTRLHTGSILTKHDCALALNLMQNVETDQQWGVGNAAPSGATFAMKNGWLPGPDGLWTVNTSGIVEAGGEIYIISVYTQEQPSLEQGQTIVQHICNVVASSLV